MAAVTGNAAMADIKALPKGLPYRCWVEVSRGQIAANFRAIRNVVGPGVDIMPVVKADAYRHGATEVSRTLEEQGARWLAVSNTDEGVALRDAGIQTRILVMADFLRFTREAMIAYGLTPVLHSLQEIAELDELAKQRGTRLRYHLKLDSGMGRLGVRDDAVEIVNAIHASANLELEGLMTHFASAGNYQAKQTDEQIAWFDWVMDGLATAGIRPAIVHMSSTIPIAYGRRAAWRSMVRPGHSIYGYVSPARGHAPAKLLDVKPALSWRATILSVKEIPAGASIGYGATFRAPEPMRVAVLAAGYADGIPHRLGNTGSVIVHGKFAPIVGAVSMDLTTIDVTRSPETQIGDAATLLGREGDLSIDAQQIARLARTISYSVLCGIHARVKRIYI
ncbi:MAG TPA: alanine racemase [Bryobacteraceae bacterium]|jgi:alanine racemase|nr:alanine racemase [Bryobacteraceae bacterium]